MKVSKLSQAITKVTEDNKVTRQEWEKDLQPLVKDLPPKAGPEARELLELRARPGLTREEYADVGLEEALQNTGYRLNDIGRVGVANIIASNVTEQDVQFASLAALVGRTDAKTHIAVLDGGFDLKHPALKGKAKRGDRVPVQQKYDDGDQHGTHVLGLATAGTGEVHASVYRITDVPRFADVDMVVRAVEKAAKAGARVINLSLAVDSSREEIRQMGTLIAKHPELLFVFAAGNQGVKLGDTERRPVLADNEFPNAIFVAATEDDGTLALFSNYGKQATVAAPARELLSTIPEGIYESKTGTSMAAPTVTNLAAKVLALDPQLGPTGLKALLTASSTASVALEGKVASGGIIDRSIALKAAALTGLIRRGAKPQDAVSTLGLEVTARAWYLAKAAEILVA